MRRQVIRADFHDLNVVLDGMGGAMPNRLPAPNKTQSQTPKMYLTEYGLEVHTQNATSLIPLANIKILVFAKEDKSVIPLTAA